MAIFRLLSTYGRVFSLHPRDCRTGSFLSSFLGFFLGKVLAWRLPEELSQSRLGGRTERSSACTLIALKLAELLFRSDSTVQQQIAGRHLPAWRPPRNASTGSGHPSPTPRCPPEFIGHLTEAILAGNELHERMVARRAADFKNREHFTIPEGIAACGNHFGEVDFCGVTGKIWNVLPRYLKFTINNAELLSQQRLFFAMIAFERCVLLVYERRSDSLLLVDSHMHRPGGGILAMAAGNALDQLADWISDYIFPESLAPNNDPKENFELSLLTFRGQLSPSDCGLLQPEIPRLCLFSSALRQSLKRINLPESKIAATPAGDEAPSKRRKTVTVN